MPRKPITPENAFLRLATLCARSEQAEGDLRKKLHDWGLTESDSDDIIARLKQERYLDNERYARAYCRDKLRFNGWGRIKIAFMLRGKDIEQEYIDAALAEINEEQYASILEDALIAKAKTLIGKSDEQMQVSLLRFASSRGFEQSAIFRAMTRISSPSKIEGAGGSMRTQEISLRNED
ncbi:MAG: RecX family transcriptional regulator [Muribaculaceae bacterium]|nr:RecX family transcriptional regulator [Muribaculaceae bacterium]